MKKEEIENFENELVQHGYCKYKDHFHSDGRYYYSKSIRKYVIDTDESPDILINFVIHDFSKFDIEENYHYSYDIEIYLDNFKKWDYFRTLIKTDMPIEKIEEMALSLLEWVNNFNNI